MLRKPQTGISKKFTPRHIIMKLLKTKDKEKTLKAARGKLWGKQFKKL